MQEVNILEEKYASAEKSDHEDDESTGERPEYSDSDSDSDSDSEDDNANNNPNPNPNPNLDDNDSTYGEE
jgi:hypothetical protein